MFIYSYVNSMMSDCQVSFLKYSIRILILQKKKMVLLTPDSVRRTISLSAYSFDYHLSRSFITALSITLDQCR